MPLTGVIYEGIIKTTTIAAHSQWPPRRTTDTIQKSALQRHITVAQEWPRHETGAVSTVSTIPKCGVIILQTFPLEP